jgi:hypothetical protein
MVLAVIAVRFEGSAWISKKCAYVLRLAATRGCAAIEAVEVAVEFQSFPARLQP